MSNSGEWTGDWSAGSLDLVLEEDIIVNHVAEPSQQEKPTTDIASPLAELLEHTWINTDESGLERPIRQEVSPAAGWVTLEGGYGPFYYHQASNTCTWTQPYNLPPDVPPTDHVPPLGVFSRRRSQKSSEQVLTESNEDDGFFKAHLYNRKQEGVHELTPEGKTAISFLHEYGVNVLRSSAQYESNVTEDPTKPYEAVITFKGKEYGRGSASTKKQAKQAAAEEVLDRICPGVYPVHLRSNAEAVKQRELSEISETQDDLRIDDERILMLAQQEKTPAQILQEYCNKEGITIEWESEPIENSLGENQFRIHAITGSGRVCHGDGKNKKEAKQRCAQQFLKIAHPNLHTWGDLLKHFALNYKQGVDNSIYPTSQLLVTLKSEIRKAIESQAHTGYDDHPDSFLDGRESVRSPNAHDHKNGL